MAIKSKIVVLEYDDYAIKIRPNKIPAIQIIGDAWNDIKGEIERKEWVIFEIDLFEKLIQSFDFKFEDILNEIVLLECFSYKVITNKKSLTVTKKNSISVIINDSHLFNITNLKNIYKDYVKNKSDIDQLQAMIKFATD